MARTQIPDFCFSHPPQRCDVRCSLLRQTVRPQPANDVSSLMFRGHRRLCHYKACFVGTRGVGMWALTQAEGPGPPDPTHFHSEARPASSRHPRGIGVISFGMSDVTPTPWVGSSEDRNFTRVYRQNQNTNLNASVPAHNIDSKE